MIEQMDNMMKQLPKHIFTLEQVQLFKQRLSITKHIPDGATHCWFGKLDIQRIYSNKPVCADNFSKIDGDVAFNYVYDKWEADVKISNCPNVYLQRFIKLSDILTDALHDLVEYKPEHTVNEIEAHYIGRDNKERFVVLFGSKLIDFLNLKQTGNVMYATRQNDTITVSTVKPEKFDCSFTVGKVNEGSKYFRSSSKSASKVFPDNLNVSARKIKIVDNSTFYFDVS
jgi:hypothetical protein